MPHPGTIEIGMSFLTCCSVVYPVLVSVSFRTRPGRMGLSEATATWFMFGHGSVLRPRNRMFWQTGPSSQTPLWLVS